MTGGLLPTPRSRKDFSATRAFGAPSLDLPARYDVEDEKGDVAGPRTQEHNFCTAYAVSELGSDEHGVPMDAHFQAAAIGMLAGAPILGGADMRDAIRSGRTFGFLPVSRCPFHGERTPREILGDAGKWPNLTELLEVAADYRMPAFFKIDGPYDPFDNLRAHLYAQRPDNGVVIGIPWYENFNRARGIIPAPKGSYTWHAVTVKGFRTVKGQEVLRVRSWNGTSFGDESYAYLTRERFNALMTTWGAIAFMYKDVPDDLIASLRERRLDLQEVILDLLSRLALLLRPWT